MWKWSICYDRTMRLWRVWKRPTMNCCDWASVVATMRWRFTFEECLQYIKAGK